MLDHKHPSPASLLSLMTPASLRSDKALTVGDQSYYYLKYTFVTEMITFNDAILAHTHTHKEKLLKMYLLHEEK